MAEELVTAGVALASVGAVYVMSAARVVRQYERGLVLLTKECARGRICSIV